MPEYPPPLDNAPATWDFIAPRQHNFHRCDKERCTICDGGLSLCKVCGGGESSLPTECPGRRMTPEEDEAVTRSQLDFVGGKWIRSEFHAVELHANPLLGHGVIPPELSADRKLLEQNVRGLNLGTAMPRVKPAECFPVGDFIRDELEARGWTARDCALRMGGNVDADELTLELHMAGVGSKMAAETAAGLAKAFGTSADVWLNLDRSYREYLKRKEEGNTCRE